MPNLLKEAADCSIRAWIIVHELQIVEHWEAVGARVNVVGSLRTGLLIHNLDIDLHIYSDPFLVTDSFQAMGCIASNPHIHSVTYQNLLDAEDRCLEWHAAYVSDAGESWQLDMIHIHPQSPYVGVFENVADRIQQALTPETKHAILAIKDAVPAGQKVAGIRVYQAVLRDGVRTYAEFSDWNAKNPGSGIISWMP
jgi:hypothetical protein